jgi:hypothetical protein
VPTRDQIRDRNRPGWPSRGETTRENESDPRGFGRSETVAAGSRNKSGPASWVEMMPRSPRLFVTFIEPLRVSKYSGCSNRLSEAPRLHVRRLPGCEA